MWQMLTIVNRVFLAVHEVIEAGIRRGHVGSRDPEVDGIQPSSPSPCCTIGPAIEVPIRPAIEPPIFAPIDVAPLVNEAPMNCIPRH